MRERRRQRQTETMERTEKNRHSRKRRTVWKAVGIIVLILLLLVGTAAGAFYYLRSAGKKSLKKEAAATVPHFEGEEAGVLHRNGKKYRYNEEITSLLFVGVDTRSDLSEIKEVSGESGQADTIFLLVLNSKTDQMKMIGISRDTMTEIRTYDYHGNDIGTSVNHLGLAYAFGDGGKTSGEMMKDAVSKLFYGLPIHGWCAINLNAIEKLNDAVGGVTVTLPEAMQLGGNSYEKGEQILLTGKEAENFVRYRDMEAEGSNNLRMSRQKQYALSFLSSAKGALKKNVTLPVSVYQEIKDQMSASLSLDEMVYLATEISGMNLNVDEIQMLSGTVKQGSVYEEFYVDEEALKDLIFDTFYVEED